ncbi:Uncharacterized conserved protein related to C-terminal domain of eukaryotic chaperone, SACSIN [Butyrivibrio fibrisolvens 16/4]|nr:Uncharacterized conserved protein related to C-terminal domain of eukaryotic chaperone, SACSIN [Butyrivibrio fibrisolvens 16/4]
MEGSMIDLSKYRFDTAVDELDTSKELLKSQKYKASVNRSYYAIFHTLRAVTALEDFDSSKHSGIIVFLTKLMLKKVYLTRKSLSLLTQHIDLEKRLIIRISMWYHKNKQKNRLPKRKNNQYNKTIYRRKMD